MYYYNADVAEQKGYGLASEGMPVQEHNAPYDISCA